MFRNDGPIEWPAGCKIVYTNGVQFDVQEKEINKLPISINECIEV